MIISFSVTVLMGCVKATLSSIPISSVTVINATEGGTGIVPVFGDSMTEWFSTAQSITPGSSYEYSIPSGQTPTVARDLSDTAVNIFRGTLNLKPQGIYSFYFAASVSVTGKGAVDTLWMQDLIPYYPTNDSICGIRFVNLVVGGDPLEVNLVGNSYGSELKGLAYKGVSAFKTYAGNIELQYNFEIRDSNTDSLWAIYSYQNIATFKNVTIVCYGIFGSSFSPGINCFMVNNF